MIVFPCRLREESDLTTTGGSDGHTSTLESPPAPPLSPARLVVRMQEEKGFTGGSLKAIREQHTDRMRAVNRGKQGRAEDTVTL